jgi:hypothetical protein
MADPEMAASVMSATGLLATSVLNFWIINYVRPADCHRSAFVLINTAWPGPVIAIVGK